MIKVLDKAFALLEMVVMNGPEPQRASELAAACGVNPATCSRILKELTQAGYLHQVSRQQGYAAGPRAWVAAQNTRYRPGLIAAARPVVETLAAKLEASVLLAERVGDERYILLHVNRCPKLRIKLTRASYHDLFDTATGLVLAAWLEPAERDAAIARYGDAEVYKLLPDCGDIRRVLAEIRENEVWTFDRFRTDQGILAVPVFRNDAMIAALGASTAVEDFHGEYKERMIAELRAGARDLGRELSVVRVSG